MKNNKQNTAEVTTINNEDNNFKEIAKFFSDSNLMDKKSTLVNAKILYDFLEIEEDYTEWISFIIKDRALIKSVDYEGTELSNYFVTMKTAKEIGMYTPNQKGRQIRRYFIKCEEVLKKVKKIVNKKDSSSIFYKALFTALNDDFNIIENEFDMIYGVLFAETKEHFPVSSNIDIKEPLRDYLSDEEIKRIEWLQQRDTLLIEMGLSFEERKDKLKELYDKKFKKAKQD